MNARPRLPRTACLPAIKAMTSPIRQEIISELGAAPATVKELSERLGRSRQALHSHVATLVRAGLVAVQGSRGSGRSEEAVYAVTKRPAGLKGLKDLSPPERRDAAKAVSALLRLTQRETTDALQCADEVVAAGLPLMAIRAKVRLDRASLREVRTLTRQLVQVFSRAKGKYPSEPPIALTLVLTPARQSKAAQPRPRSTI